MGSSASSYKNANDVELMPYGTLDDIPYISLNDAPFESEEDNIHYPTVDRDNSMRETDTILTNLNPTNSLSKFFDNRHVILRCILILLSLFLGACSVLYAIGQITTLQLTNYFCSPVSLEEIRQHSKEKQLAYGDYDDCWISKGIKVNNQKLYSLNAYEGKVIVNGPLSIFTLSIFLCIGCWLIFCCFYFAYLLVRDLKKYLSGYYSRSRHNAILKSPQSKMNTIWSSNCIRKIKKFGKSITNFYKKYFGPDKALWAFSVFALETFEIALQSIVCLGYAGVQVNLAGTTSKDKHTIAIAWQEVLIYVCIIGFNSICTGILWLLYVFKHDIFKGDTFHYTMFLVDAIFDTLYVLFPLAVVIYDGNDLKYSVGALNIETFSKFFSAFWPLLLLCIKVFTASNTMIRKNEERWYQEFSTKFIGIDGNVANSPGAKKTVDLKEMKEMYNPDQFWKVFTSGQKLIDATNPNETPELIARQTIINPIDAQLYLNYRRQQWFRKSCLVFMALLYCLFGIIIIILSTYFFHSAIDECDNPSYEILQNHLELLTWPYCSYKVYPFTGMDSLNDIPCQCKALLISESDYIEIGMNESIINDVFSEFYSLQNIKLSSPRLQETNIRFTNEMMIQRSIRSVSINGFHITDIDEMGILNWNSIEYLEFNLSRVNTMPNTTGQLKNIKYLNLAWNAIDNIDWICNFHGLKYLNINGNPIPRTPSCIYTDLKKLNTLHFATVNGFFDYRMLALPELLSLKAIGTHIEKTDFPNNISFIYNISTSVEFQANVLCDQYYGEPEKISNYSHRVWKFLNETNACHKYCRYNEEALYAHCQFSEWKNGVCDVGCNNLYCGYDGGDCNQLCDTNICDESLWINEKCDDECNINECSNDFGDCLFSNDTSKMYEQCFEYTQCKEEYINDASDQTSWCDNDCNNALCKYDDGDCIDCSADKDCYQYWQYFVYISNLFNDDYLIESDELCNIWDFYVAGYGDDVDYNCTSLIHSFDVDGNLKLNAYETSRIFFDEDDERPDQINCSICAVNIESYYAPWNFDTIPYWVNVTKHKKHGNVLKNESNYHHDGILS